MEFFAKTFDELTTKELYEILKSRSQIFTIEQNIHCQDMDDIDYNYCNDEELDIDPCDGEFNYD